MALNFNPSKVLGAPDVFQHGLLVGVLFVLASATISGETLEFLTGMVGALIVCAMKERSSRRRKCQEAWLGSISVRKFFPRLHKAEPKTQTSFVNGTPRGDQELLQLRACVQAELNALRAECKLENWKLQAEKAAAELEQLEATIADREQALCHADSSPDSEETAGAQIEDLLLELSEAKQRAEEVQAELAHSQSKMAELENDVAQAASIQERTEQTAQTRLDALSMDFAKARDQDMEMQWLGPVC